MIEMVNFRDKEYPKFQTNGNAARFIIPFALEFCKGEGVDVGCNRVDWKFPNAYPIDPEINQWHATNFPYEDLDYVFSSHCLEHIVDWVGTIEYWSTKIKSGGVIFLYLPDYSQEYWRPWNNRKHIHSFNPQMFKDYFESTGIYRRVLVSGVDLYNAFTVVAEKF